MSTPRSTTRIKLGPYVVAELSRGPGHDLSVGCLSTAGVGVSAVDEQEIIVHDGEFRPALEGELAVFRSPAGWCIVPTENLREACSTSSGAVQLWPERDHPHRRGRSVYGVEHFNDDAATLAAVRSRQRPS